jgi:PEP-CTERM/exosortase A-associated glycosyltransferase
MTTEGSTRYRLSRALETYVVRRADAVVVICDGLKDELVKRGVAEERITVIPNALPPDMFDLPDPDSVAAVRERYKLGGARVIGFFGSFFEWEGVDELIKTLPQIVNAVPDAHLLLAGGGRQEDTLRRLVAELDLETNVTLAGRVSHRDVKALYGAVDVMAFPRVAHRLTEMVTPIKPLEAMAQQAAVVASDVGGHRELIRDNQTGVLYPAGNRQALAKAIVEILQSPEIFGEMRERAREYVEQKRRWSVVAKRYLPVYEAIG